VKKVFNQFFGKISEKKLFKVHLAATQYKRKILCSGASVPKRLSTEKRNLELHRLPGALSKGQGK
jgi:hypothetical protein